MELWAQSGQKPPKMAKNGPKITNFWTKFYFYGRARRYIAHKQMKTIEHFMKNVFLEKLYYLENINPLE